MAAYNNPTVRRALAQLAVGTSDLIESEEKKTDLPPWVRRLAGGTTDDAPRTATVSGPDGVTVEFDPAQTSPNVVVVGVNSGGRGWRRQTHHKPAVYEVVTLAASGSPADASGYPVDLRELPDGGFEIERDGMVFRNDAPFQVNVKPRWGK